MAQLDRLQQDAAHLKEELHTLAGKLESRTRQAALIEEQAEVLVHEAEDQATSKVLLQMLLSMFLPAPNKVLNVPLAKQPPSLNLIAAIVVFEGIINDLYP